MPKRINNIYEGALTFTKIKNAYERAGFDVSDLE